MPATPSWRGVLSLAVALSTETEEAWSPVVERPSLASPRRSLSQHKRAPAGAPPREELSNVGPRECAKSNAFTDTTGDMWASPPAEAWWESATSPLHRGCGWGG